MNNPRLIDGDKLLEYLRRIKVTLTPTESHFDAGYLDATNMYIELLERGAFDATSNQGEATRLREALQSIYEESDDPGARACAADALGINIPGISDGGDKDA